MPKQFICPKCNHIGKPKRKKRGSGRLEIFGWSLFPLGVPYTLWRIFTKFPVCKICGNDMLIDADSIIGQRLLHAREFDDPPATPKALEVF